MAHVRVSYRFSDGDELDAEVYVEDGAYPDALDDARNTCVKAHREAMRDALGLLKGEE